MLNFRLIKSELKLESFNLCPGPIFEDMIKGSSCEIEIVDVVWDSELGRKYDWVNGRDRAVIHVKSKNYRDYVPLLTEPYMAEIISWEDTDDGVLFRFWWD